MAKVYAAKGYGALTPLEQVKLRKLAEDWSNVQTKHGADDFGLWVEVPEEIAQEIRGLLFMKSL